MVWEKDFKTILEKHKENGQFLIETDHNKSIMEQEDKHTDSIRFIY
jgi:hypothetical protein